MFKKYSILVGLIVLCIILSCSSVLAMDFETLPSGIDITAAVPTGYEVIQTGETDKNTVYVVSAVLTNNADGSNLSPKIGAVNIVGFNKATGSLAYHVTYTQPGNYAKISAKSKNFFYLVQTKGSAQQVAKINLDTGAIDKYLDGNIASGGTVQNVDINPTTLNVKFISISALDNVYLLAKQTTDNYVRILKNSTGGWVKTTEIILPSVAGTGTPHTFCVASDSGTSQVFYSAYGDSNYTKVFKTEGDLHILINYNPNPSSDTYYGVSMIPGVNDKDMIYIFYSAARNYIYYFNYQTTSFKQVYASATNYFTNKYYNLVYLPDGDNASFTFWNGTYGSYNIDGTGKWIPVQLPTNASQTIPLSVSGSQGNVQPKVDDLAHEGSTSDVIVTGNQLSWGSLLATNHCTYKANAGTHQCIYYYNNRYYGPVPYDTYTHNGTAYYYAHGTVYLDGNTANGSTTIYQSYDSNWNCLGWGNLFNYGGTYFPTHYVVKQSLNMSNTDLSKTYTILGGFGARTMNSWMITSTVGTTSYTAFKPFKTLREVVGSSGTTTYNVTNNSTTGGSTPVAAPASYTLTVLKDVTFKEVISDDLLGTSTAPSGNITFIRKSVTSGSTTLYYTVASGTLSDADIDAATSTKGVIVNGKLVVFKVVAPPTSSATAATIQFN